MHITKIFLFFKKINFFLVIRVIHVHCRNFEKYEKDKNILKSHHLRISTINILEYFILVNPHPPSINMFAFVCFTSRIGINSHFINLG